MYKKAWCTCKVVVLLIKPFVFFGLSRCRHRRRCLSSLLFCYAVSPSIHRFLSNHLKTAEWGIQIVATTFITVQSVIILIFLLLIGHFRVPEPLTFKMRLGAQPFLWKWVLFAWESKMISMSKAEHLPSFWNRSPGELGNGLITAVDFGKKCDTFSLDITSAK